MNPSRPPASDFVPPAVASSTPRTTFYAGDRGVRIALALENKYCGRLSGNKEISSTTGAGDFYRRFFFESYKKKKKTVNASVNSPIDFF